MYPLEINNNDEIKDESKKKTFTKMLNKNEFFNFKNNDFFDEDYLAGFQRKEMSKSSNRTSSKSTKIINGKKTVTTKYIFIYFYLCKFKFNIK